MAPPRGAFSPSPPVVVLLGNALLHSVRPAHRFERYYLVLAAGGVIGGLLSSSVIPYVLSRPVEFELASVALLASGMIWLTGRREPSIALVIGSDRPGDSCSRPGDSAGPS